ncbi:MAG: threonine/serine exporter family protein [Anaerolineales bacterium]|nr:threonine/serine exporter family protein [Anaerolineales bacterium]
MNQQNPEQVSFDATCRFVIKLGLASHAYGSTPDRLEAYLLRLTEALGYRGTFQSTPNNVEFAFQEQPDQWQKRHLATTPVPGLDLDKLTRVGDILNAVVAKEITVVDASAQLDEIAKRPVPWGKIANTFSYACVGAGLVILLGGGWIEVLAGTLLSMLVYGMVLFAERTGTRSTDWLPLSTAFVVATLVTVAKIWIPELNIVFITLAAVAVLLPGYSISLGIIELVTQQVISGTMNLMSGFVYLVKQIAGAWLGVGLVSIFFTIPTTSAGTTVNRTWLWLFMPLLIIGLCVIFQTARRDFLWACVACAIAYGGIVLGSFIVNANLGNFLGTILAVVFANLWARQTKRPISIVLLPAIILLVSGSIGFRGLAAIAEGKTDVGVQQFSQMFIVALTIAAGLLVGNTVVRPKVTL